MKSICWCGKTHDAPTLYELETVNAGVAFCDQHKQQIERHPVIYVDGLGTDSYMRFTETAQRFIKTKNLSWTVVPLFPAVFEGNGIYSTLQRETFQRLKLVRQMITEATVEKPLLIVNSPFYQVAVAPAYQSDSIGELQRYRHLLLNYFRPTVWIWLPNHRSLDFELFYEWTTKHKPRTFVFTYKMTWGQPIKRQTHHVWNTAMNLWRIATQNKNEEGHSNAESEASDCPAAG